MSQTTRILAGAMSGTSADGVDVALVRIDGRGLEMKAQFLHHNARPYPRELSQRIHRIRGEGHCRLEELAMLGREISIEYAEAVNAALAGANLKPSDIAAIAAHGQTLFHSPPNTIQWFDPSLVASRTGCAVVSDFRRADLAAGGQGAPLVPFADYILFRHPEKSRVLLNIGGIANLTYIPPGSGINDIVAFDAGPGNCISDWLMRESKTNCYFDEGGQLALSGDADFKIAFEMARSRYAFRKPPKSTDGPEMISIWKEVCTGLGAPSMLEDALATACQTTAQAICFSMDLFCKKWREEKLEIIVSGGGVDNQCMMRELRSVFSDNPSVRLLRSDELGMVSAAKEAIAFALLGAATLDNEPSNVPSVTGASRRVVLGSITPKP